MNETLRQALNQQMNREFYSWYLYLAMSAYFEAQSLPGFAHWMRVQAQEELEHAMKFYRYLSDRGARIELAAIESPPVEFPSPREAVRMAPEHERAITRHIHQLYRMATEQNDQATQVFLHWFITEQVEEEKLTEQLLHRVSQVEQSPAAMLFLDHHLGQREPESE